VTDTTPPMSRARRWILAVGVPVALGLIALSTSAWVSGAIQALGNLNPIGYSVAFSAPTGPHGVRLTVSDGDLTFHTGPGRRIRVRGTLRGSLAAPSLSHQRTATGLTLTPRCRAPIGVCGVSFTATAPTGLPIDINDSFGQLDTSDLRGDITLSSNSGNIRASRLSGTIRLNDSFGQIDVTGVSGRSITMNSSSGDIIAAGLTGDTQIFESYGSVNVTGIAAANVYCTSQAGDITIVFRTVPRNVQVTDSYGSVTLELPDTGTHYDVHTRNPYGSTVVSVPQGPIAQNKITVSDNSGDITITRQGHAPGSQPATSHPTPTSAP
jgi:hypothetical protein